MQQKSPDLKPSVSSLSMVSETYLYLQVSEFLVVQKMVGKVEDLKTMFPVSFQISYYCLKLKLDWTLSK